jgi:hypothetical protein
MFVGRCLNSHHGVGKHSGAQIKLFDPLLDSHRPEEHSASVGMVQVAKQNIGLRGLRQPSEVQTVFLVVGT